jgi:hypothetical protein
MGLAAALRTILSCLCSPRLSPLGPRALRLAKIQSPLRLILKNLFGITVSARLHFAQNLLRYLVIG